MLIRSMAINEQAIMESGKIFFCIFFIMVAAASNIKRPTAILMPLNAFAIIAISRKLSRHMEIAKMIANDGRTMPKVAANEPRNPAC